MEAGEAVEAPQAVPVLLDDRPQPGQAAAPTGRALTPNGFLWYVGNDGRQSDGPISVLGKALARMGQIGSIGLRGVGCNRVPGRVGRPAGRLGSDLDSQSVKRYLIRAQSAGGPSRQVIFLPSA